MSEYEKDLADVTGSFIETEPDYAEKSNKEIVQLKQENNRLLELCMFALIRDTKIYSHELDNTNKLKLMDTIRNNLNNDTYTLRKKLINVWEGNNE